MNQQLTAFVQWFYENNQTETLDYKKILTVAPIVSTIGYLTLQFGSFVLTSQIYSYYGIGLGYWSFNKNTIFLILMSVMYLFGTIFWAGKYFKNGCKSSIDRVIKLLFVLSIWCFFLVICNIAIINAANIAIVWQYIIAFLTLIISFLIAHFVPKILKSIRGLICTIGVCIALTCGLVFMLNTYWKNNYHTVVYDSNNYIIGACIDNQFYLIEYKEGEILTNHYRFVDRTDVNVIRQKLSLHPVNE